MSGYSISDALAHREQPAASSQPPRQRRWRRVLLVVLVLATVGGGGLLAARHFLAEDDVYASPATVDLPALPAELGPVQEYLAGSEGAMVQGLIEAADQALAGGSGTASCETAIATLDGLGGPQQVFAAAEGVPDPDTAEMAVRHASALSRFLGVCLSDTAAPESNELEFTTTVLRRRLEEFR